MAALGDISGQETDKGLDRVLALSDVVFAFALTLIVLDLAPALPSGQMQPEELIHQLGNESSRFLSYVISFFVI